jgi:hypothetical protein
LSYLIVLLRRKKRRRYMQRRCGVRWNLPRAREKIPEVGCWHCSIGSAALIVHWLRALKESAVDKNIAVHR